MSKLRKRITGHDGDAAIEKLELLCAYSRDDGGIALPGELRERAVHSAAEARRRDVYAGSTSAICAMQQAGSDQFFHRAADLRDTAVQSGSKLVDRLARCVTRLGD